MNGDHFHQTFRHKEPQQALGRDFEEESYSTQRKQQQTARNHSSFWRADSLSRLGSVFSLRMSYHGGGGGASRPSSSSSASSLSSTFSLYSSAPSYTISTTRPSMASSSFSSLIPQSRSTKELDEDFWTYVGKVLFTRFPADKTGRISMLDLTEAIHRDTYLSHTYGDEKIEGALSQVDDIRFMAHSKVGGGLALCYVNMEEFRSKIAGPAKSPKRRRQLEEGEEKEEAAAAVVSPPFVVPAGVGGREGGRNISSKTVPALFGDDRLAYRKYLESKIDGYKEEEALMEEEVALIGQQVDALQSLGRPHDDFLGAIKELDAVVSGRQEERQKIAKYRRDREAELKRRMEVDLVGELAKKKIGPLTSEQQAEVQGIFRGSPNDIICKGFNVDMLRMHLCTLRPGTWLNDEVINFFFNLLQGRDNDLVAAEPGRRKNYFFNSFFFTKLLDDGGFNYKNVRRWSKKAGDLFACEKVFFPVNLQNTHWCLAVIYMQKKVIQYYDSMAGGGDKYLNGLKKYLEHEHQDKKGTPIDLSDWQLKRSSPNSTPQQQNGCDCGVFASSFAHLLSIDIPIKYVSQNHMPDFRKRMAYSIKHLKLEF